MTEVAALVARSLRILRVIDPDEEPEPRQYETAIETLNAMLRRWEASGLALGWSDVADPADQIPIPAEAEECVAFNLAVKLRTEYGVTIDPDAVAFAQSGLSALRRDVKVATPMTFDRSRGGYNTYTDQID